MIDRATEYALSVMRGEVVAGKAHKMACMRHLSDIKRQNTPGFPYVWVPEKSERILEFAETLTIAEGESPQTVKLYGFQHFDLGVPMGWYNLRGYRRFRRKYKSVSRQNGKTFENGITGTYLAGFSRYKYGKLFTVATKKRQARIAWEEISKFISVDSDLKELFRVQDYKSVITATQTQCTIEALSKEAGLDDGFRSIFSSVDEIHQHKSNSVYKALYNGTRTLKETLISMITTRGRALNSFCYEMDAYCVNILNGVAVAEDFFVDIYTLDDGDDPFDEKVWIKANPFTAQTPEGMEALRTDAQTARDMGGSELSDFLTKCMNKWVYAQDNQYIDVEKWNTCGTELSLSDMRGKRCWVGIDLSSGGDLTSIALEFPLDDEMIYFYSHSFMPYGRLEEHIKSDIAPYDIWETEGLITVTGGSGDYKNDYKFIISHLKDIITEYDLKIQGIAYDPHNADGILSDLEDFGVELMMITQSARFLSDATTDLQLSVKSEKVRYDKKNDLMSWSVANAKKVANSFGEIKVDKEPNAKNKRIDPVDAMIDAHVMMMKAKMTEKTDINDRMAHYLQKMGWAKQKPEDNSPG